jgi:hypothetical protein
MTLLIAGSLALLVVYAGVKLHIQTKKETLGNPYRCAAWFFIVSGFLILACSGACCIAKCCKYGMGMMHKEKMMGYGGDGDMKQHDHFKKKMNCHYHEEEGQCEAECCSRKMERCCSYMEVCKKDSIGNKK